ncbi:MAG: hypothetical protein KME07_05860 [Pegethrix bostrychoides GSE-TBD4-15B]|jgi:hypothetical protein|uniref:Uncharacterized protein n=1 Tax=Pegethrix bostrychoides GSE-TBD4-15B TaxID=2839662 RepID=A0A951P997_9CYAN|nr:hypothetical protein [Pegethrix bostrychoides GSE-TBD4-15B]
MNLADILKDSDYKLSQFTSAEIEQLEQAITLKPTKNGDVPYTVCLVRQKAIKLTPEETIRQLYLQILTDRLRYPLDRIRSYCNATGAKISLAPSHLDDEDEYELGLHQFYVKLHRKHMAEAHARRGDHSVQLHRELVLPVVNSKHVREGEVILTTKNQKQSRSLSSKARAIQTTARNC